MLAVTRLKMYYVIMGIQYPITPLLITEWSRRSRPSAPTYYNKYDSEIIESRFTKSRFDEDLLQTQPTTSFT